MPKYIEIANILRKRIKDGVYPKGSFLPHQTELAKEFAASRMTIKNAVNILTMEGLLLSKRGAGTKILNHAFTEKDTSSVNEYKGLTYQMNQQNRQLKSKVITFEVCFPNQRVQEMLKITAEDPIYHFIRLRILDGQPYVLEHSFMPVELVPGLTKEILHQSVYNYLLEELNYKFAGAYRVLNAAKSDSYDQEYLNCKVDDPVLELEQTIYLENGRGIDYSYSRNRYDTRSYSMLDIKPDLLNHRKS